MPRQTLFLFLWILLLLAAFVLPFPTLTLLFLIPPRYGIFPGFCDMHVHFREPGFFYKESIMWSRSARQGKWEKRAFAVVGIETALPILYTYLGKSDILDIDRMMELIVARSGTCLCMELSRDCSIWRLEGQWQLHGGCLRWQDCRYGVNLSN